MVGIFPKEVDLCEAFIETLPKGWTNYNETGGYDILLVHDETGFQIGIEAKLRLNAKVVCQALSGLLSSYNHQAPDCRAVLVPSGVNHDLKVVCDHLNLTVITVNKRSWSGSVYGCNNSKSWSSQPLLPTPIAKKHLKWDAYLYEYTRDWYDFGPTERLTLPEYVPDVAAGASAPMTLSTWKIKAMRVSIWVECNTTITRAHFKALDVSPSMWMNGYWLKKGDTRGEWIKADHFPDYRAQHPSIYEQIETDYDKWVAEAKLSVPEKQEALL